MKNDLIAAADSVSEFLKAFSGRSRLLLLCELWEGEKSVGELARSIGARDTAVSQQLAVLRREGLVRTRRDGQTIYYSLARHEVREMLTMLHRMFGSPREV
ncbi:MAG: ArsR/SmtB family transcription factor [Pseudomonadota bacterium]